MFNLDTPIPWFDWWPRSWRRHWGITPPSRRIAPWALFQLDNHLGTACVETDETGAVITYEEYHPYGTSAYRAFKSGVEVSAKRYRYTGKERDEETSLYYHGARYYAPWLGRWTQADPAGLVDGPGLFNYCRGSPVVMSDPSGTEHRHFSQVTIEKTPGERTYREFATPSEQETASEFVSGEGEAAVELGGEISGPAKPKPRVFKPHTGAAVVPSRRDAEKAEKDVNKLKALANAAVVELTSDLEFLLSLTGPEPSFTGGETSVPFPGDRSKAIEEQVAVGSSLISLPKGLGKAARKTAKSVLQRLSGLTKGPDLDPGIKSFGKQFEEIGSAGKKIDVPDAPVTPKPPSATGIRRVGDVLETVEDSIANPNLLEGLNPGDVLVRIGGNIPANWKQEALGLGRHEGLGWVLREYTAAGKPTGRMLRWHPGGGHHGPDPYWRAVGFNTKSGIISAAAW